jgi:hypothetical protein
MEPLNATATAALRHLLQTQPISPAKVAFAWRMAAGPAVDRATSTNWRSDGVLVVRAAADAWRREVKGARHLLLQRLQELLGRDVIVRIDVE